MARRSLAGKDEPAPPWPDVWSQSSPPGDGRVQGSRPSCWFTIGRNGNLRPATRRSGAAIGDAPGRRAGARRATPVADPAPRAPGSPSATTPGNAAPSAARRAKRSAAPATTPEREVGGANAVPGRSPPDVPGTGRGGPARFRIASSILSHPGAFHVRCAGRARGVDRRRPDGCLPLCLGLRLRLGDSGVPLFPNRADQVAKSGHAPSPFMIPQRA